MKIRKSALQRDLRNMPIDHGDMFLMSRTEDLVDVSEVADIMPWETKETERRLAALVKLGLLEWVGEHGQPLSPAECQGTDFFVAVTLRPKAPQPVADLFRQTETAVVALRSADGLVLLDQAVIHQDRSVFSRATFVREEPSRSAGQSKARPKPVAADDMHFSLPPLVGAPAPAQRVREEPRGAGRSVQQTQQGPFALPSLVGKPPPQRATAPLFEDPADAAPLSLPPFPDEEERADDFVLPSMSGQGLDRPWGEMATQPRLNHVRKPAPPVNHQPIPVARRQESSGAMPRATRAYEGEQVAALSRATRTDAPPERAPARREPTVHDRRTVVDEDAEERSTLFERGSRLKQGRARR